VPCILHYLHFVDMVNLLAAHTTACFGVGCLDLTPTRSAEAVGMKQVAELCKTLFPGCCKAWHSKAGNACTDVDETRLKYDMRLVVRDQSSSYATPFKYLATHAVVHLCALHLTAPDAWWCLQF